MTADGAGRTAKQVVRDAMASGGSLADVVVAVVSLGLERSLREDALLDTTNALQLGLLVGMAIGVQDQVLATALLDGGRSAVMVQSAVDLARQLYDEFR